MSKTAVVILNWNTRDYLDKFLPPLLGSVSGMDADIVVADSASTDGSLDLVSEKFPSVKQVPLKENYGFTGGYNRSFEAIEADKHYNYFVLINSDIEVSQNWLSPLVQYMDSHPECGACSPKLHSWLDKDMFEYAGAAGGLLDSYGYPFCRGRILSHLDKDCGQYDNEISEVLWGTGACLLVRTSVWKKLGGLDDRFFAHMEEIDLCWRMQLEGYRVVVLPQSIVWHLGGGTLPKSSPFKLMLNYRNNIMLLQNNLSRTLALKALKNGKSISSAARAGKLRADFRLLVRKVLDGGSALVYLLSGKFDSVKAVYQAHREASSMGHKLSIAEIEKFLSEHPDSHVAGFGGSVFVKYFKTIL
ncbi:MAG: glycosyltransferase family 2 protein [Bacteroidales bacterium]|nr:glycosyltransferase family 2 protein [Bacteroidales bacterium]